MPTDTCYVFNNDYPAIITGIKSFNSDGFRVGNSGYVNTNCTTYHYIAWKASSGKMAVGSYTGNATDNRNITGVGFQPEYLIIRSAVQTAGYEPVQKMASTAKDSAAKFGTDSFAVNRIQDLQSDGFQVGTDNTVNASGTTYYLIAFGRSTPLVSLNPLIAYSDYSYNDLNYSTYWSGFWGPGTLAYDHSSYLYWKVAKTGPNYDRQVAVWVDSSDNFYASIWNGSGWSTTSLGLINSVASDYRCFDAAYEQSSGQLLIAASDTTAGVIKYWVWDGSSWIINGSTVSLSYSSGAIHWVKMASKPNSNEIALVLGTADSYVYALIWDGDNNAWRSQSASNRLSSGYLSSNTTEAIAVEYEQGGDNQALFAWGESDDIYWATWNGSSIS